MVTAIIIRMMAIADFAMNGIEDFVLVTTCDLSVEACAANAVLSSSIREDSDFSFSDWERWSPYILKDDGLPWREFDGLP